jgi:hypothetical protein
MALVFMTAYQAAGTPDYSDVPDKCREKYPGGWQLTKGQIMHSILISVELVS